MALRQINLYTEKKHLPFMRQKEIQTRTSYRSGFRARKEPHDHSPMAVQGAPHSRSFQGSPRIEHVVVGWGGVRVWGKGG